MRRAFRHDDGKQEYSRKQRPQQLARAVGREESAVAAKPFAHRTTLSDGKLIRQWGDCKVRRGRTALPWK